ncbi:MAG: hypothetical protein ACAI35_26060, partial [Candidatus Methylacidiphilales bacterium]
DVRRREQRRRPAAQVEGLEVGRVGYDSGNGMRAFISDGVGAEHQAADCGVAPQRADNAPAPFDAQALFAQIKPPIRLHGAARKGDGPGIGPAGSEVLEQRIELGHRVRRLPQRLRRRTMQRIMICGRGRTPPSVHQLALFYPAHF